MADRINPPVLQSALVAWGAICLVGAAVGARNVATYPSVSGPWQAGFAVIVISLLGWLAVAAIVWFDQREIAVEDDAFIVRRWTEIVFGQRGQRLPRNGKTQATLYGGQLPVGLRLHNQSGSIKFMTNLWPRTALLELPIYLARHGVEITSAGSWYDD